MPTALHDSIYGQDENKHMTAGLSTHKRNHVDKNQESSELEKKRKLLDELDHGRSPKKKPNSMAGELE